MCYKIFIIMLHSAYFIMINTVFLFSYVLLRCKKDLIDSFFNFRISAACAFIIFICYGKENLCATGFINHGCRAADHSCCEHYRIGRKV